MISPIAIYLFIAFSSRILSSSTLNTSFIFAYSSSLFEEIAAIPIPPNLKLHETSSICNRNHEALPLAQRFACLQNQSSASNFLPGLFCTSCKVCVAVYKPEDLSNCHSTNSASHYKSIEDILQSSDYNKVHSWPVF